MTKPNILKLFNEQISLLRVVEMNSINIFLLGLCSLVTFSTAQPPPGPPPDGSFTPPFPFPNGFSGMTPPRGQLPNRFSGMTLPHLFPMPTAMPPMPPPEGLPEGFTPPDGMTLPDGWQTMPTGDATMRHSRFMMESTTSGRSTWPPIRRSTRQRVAFAQTTQKNGATLNQSCLFAIVSSASLLVLFL